MLQGQIDVAVQPIPALLRCEVPPLQFVVRHVDRRQHLEQLRRLVAGPGEQVMVLAQVRNAQPVLAVRLAQEATKGLRLEVPASAPTELGEEAL